MRIIYMFIIILLANKLAFGKLVSLFFLNSCDKKKECDKPKKLIFFDFLSPDVYMTRF